MRILLVHNRYITYGGEDAVFGQERNMLRAHGHELRLITPRNTAIAERNLLSVGMQAVWSRDAKRMVARDLASFSPDIVHLHNFFPLVSPAAYYACQQAGVPVIQTLHNYRLVCPVATLFRAGAVCEECIDKAIPWPGVWHGCYRGSRLQSGAVAAMLAVHRLLRTWQDKVDAFIVPSGFAREKLVGRWLPPTKVWIKPNFVDPDPGMGHHRGQFILFVGRLTPEKGISTLIKAWRRLEPIPLKIAGDGPLLPDLRREMQVSAPSPVDLLGPVQREQVFDLMKSCRALVFPSEWFEVFPMTIAEAFACGAPVIASRLGAMAEIIEEGHTGLLFAPGDAEDLAKKVDWAWAHPEEMARMGRQARKEFEEKYTAESNYEMLMEIYQSAIAGRRGPAL